MNRQIRKSTTVGRTASRRSDPASGPLLIPGPNLSGGALRNPSAASESGAATAWAAWVETSEISCRRCTRSVKIEVQTHCMHIMMEAQMDKNGRRSRSGTCCASHASVPPPRLPPAPRCPTHHAKHEQGSPLRISCRARGRTGVPQVHPRHDRAWPGLP